MRKLIVCNIISLDGQYVVGPDWPFEIMDEAFDAYNAERLHAADTLLRTWDGSGNVLVRYEVRRQEP